MTKKSVQLSDKELMKNASEQNRSYSVSTLPEHLRKIAQAAARHGVVIRPDSTWDAITKEPSFKDLQAHVGGYVEVVEIPAQGEARTIMIVNEEGKIKGMPSNPIASYFTLQAIVGTVVWLPREYLK